MAWYYIVLIVICVIILLWFIFRKLTRPKFKHTKTKKAEAEKPKVNVQMKEGVGLNLEDQFNSDPSLYAEMNVDKKNMNDQRRQFREREFSKIREKMNQQKKEKSLAEQIRELPPAIQMLIFDRGLARKEYDFKSKKS